MAKKGTKISQTANAKKIFNNWEKKGRPTLQDGNGEGSYTFEKDEVFVPVYDEKKRKLNKKMYIGNKSGIVISAANGSVKVCKPDFSLKYIKSGGHFVHREVFFSFLYDQEITGNDHKINVFGIKEIDEKVINLLAKGNYKIHHKDTNTHNNSLDNLMIAEESIHTAIHEVANLENPIEKIIRFSEKEKDVFKSDQYAVFQLEENGEKKIELNEYSKILMKDDITLMLTTAFSEEERKIHFEKMKIKEYEEKLQQICTANFFKKGIMSADILYDGIWIKVILVKISQKSN